MQVSLNFKTPINTWEVQRDNCQDRQCCAASWLDLAHSKKDRIQAEAVTRRILGHDTKLAPVPPKLTTKVNSINSVWLSTAKCLDFCKSNPEPSPVYTAVVSNSWEGQKAAENFLLHPIPAERTGRGSWAEGFRLLAHPSAVTEWFSVQDRRWLCWVKCCCEGCAVQGTRQAAKLCPCSFHGNTAGRE